MKGVEVNVYSDASVRKDALGGTAWGCVVVRPGAEPFEASGRFATETLYRISCSTMIAELRAAANALNAALKAGLIKPGDRVVLRLDSKDAIRWIDGQPFKRSRTRNREECQAVVAWLNETATGRGFDLSAQWVKGHQRADSPDPHAIHNRRADKLATKVTGTAAVRKSRKRPPKAERERLKAAEFEAAQARAAAIRAERPDFQKAHDERKARVLRIAVDGELRS